jgi:hypothetical protein
LQFEIRFAITISIANNGLFKAEMLKSALAICSRQQESIAAGFKQHKVVIVIPLRQS